MDLPFGHHLWHAVDVAVDDVDRLRVTTDVGAFHHDRSGRIVVRLHTSEATTVARMLATNR